MEAELPFSRVIDGYADHIRGQQVAGELDAHKIESQGCGQCLCQRRFADPRNVLDQKMASGQQAGQCQSDRLLASNYDLVDPYYRRIQGLSQ